MGLALFTLSGVGFALGSGLPMFIASLIGVITGTFGGVLRDVVSNEIPVIFRPGSLYAVSSFAGAWVFLGGMRLGLAHALAAALAFVTIVALRLVSVRFGVRVPDPLWLHEPRLLAPPPRAATGRPIPRPASRAAPLSRTAVTSAVAAVRTAQSTRSARRSARRPRAPPAGAAPPAGDGRRLAAAAAPPSVPRADASRSSGMPGSAAAASIRPRYTIVPMLPSTAMPSAPPSSRARLGDAGGRAGPLGRRRGDDQVVGQRERRRGAEREEKRPHGDGREAARDAGAGEHDEAGRRPTRRPTAMTRAAGARRASAGREQRADHERRADQGSVQSPASQRGEPQHELQVLRDEEVGPERDEAGRARRSRATR